jgi:hypothetical protein
MDICCSALAGCGLPRFIRVGLAPRYLGMCRRVFNETVRPHLTEIRIGKQGVAFDRQELDAFATRYRDAHKVDNPHPASKDMHRSECRRYLGEPQLCAEKELPALRSDTVSGTSTSRSQDIRDFAEALELARARMPKKSSPRASTK